MKALLLGCFTFLNLMWAAAQDVVIEARVVDSINRPIPGVQLIDEDGELWGVTTNAEGQFRITSEPGVAFGLKKAGFDIRWTKVPYSSGKLKYTLTRKTLDLDAIVITRKNSEKALDIDNYNIIAYQPLGDEILTLKHKRNQYYIGLDKIDNASKNDFLWTKERPLNLFFDCLSNPYILTKDSAYQIAIWDSKLEITNVAGIAHFKSTIIPCVAAFDQGIVLNSFEDFNQTYDLVIHSKDSHKTVYSFTDELTYQAAWESYSKMVGIGSSQLITGDDITDEQLYQELRRKRREIYRRNNVGPDFQRALKAQDAAFMNAQVQSGVNAAGPAVLSTGQETFGRDFGASDEATNLGEYLMFSHPISIKTFQLGNYMAVVNFEFDSVSIIDYKGVLLSKKPFKSPADIEQVIQDKSTGHIYLYTNDGSHKVYLLNAFTGETTFVKDFGILKHAPDVRIYDNKLYYRTSENQFYQINRVALPILEYLN